MLKGSLVSVILMFIFIPIPVVHFFAVPLSPFIGGYIGGSIAKAEREKIKQASLEEQERIKQANLEEQERIKQASLEEKEKIKAEKAARKAERKRLKAEWKKACSDDPESKACKEGKPSEKIINVLKKIE